MVIFNTLQLQETAVGIRQSRNNHTLQFLASLYLYTFKCSDGQSSYS